MSQGITLFDTPNYLYPKFQDATKTINLSLSPTGSLVHHLSTSTIYMTDPHAQL